MNKYIFKVNAILNYLKNCKNINIDKTDRRLFNTLWQLYFDYMLITKSKYKYIKIILLF